MLILLLNFLYYIPLFRRAPSLNVSLFCFSIAAALSPKLFAPIYPAVAPAAPYCIAFPKSPVATPAANPTVPNVAAPAAPIIPLLVILPRPFAPFIIFPLFIYLPANVLAPLPIFAPILGSAPLVACPNALPAAPTPLLAAATLPPVVPLAAEPLPPVLPGLPPVVPTPCAPP